MSQDLPRISIVTPSFNQGRFLEATIRSVLDQGYPDLEYIVIDGGSTDDSPGIIRRYADRLRYWCSEPDGGHYSAINKGFRHATGDVMAWLNSDDVYLPWTLRTIGTMMRDLPEVEWVTTLSPGFMDYEGNVTHVGRIVGFSREAFLAGCFTEGSDGFRSYIQQESTFWRRSLWERAGGRVRDELRLAADFDLWARFYLHAELHGTLAPLACFRVQQEQRSRNKGDYVDEAQESLRRARIAAHRMGLIDQSNGDLLHPPFRARRIDRADAERPGSRWVVAEHRFM